MAKAKVESIGKTVKAKKPTNKITTTVAAFLAALKNTTAVEKKTSIPILQYARIKDTEVIGTDLDVTTIVPFEGTGTGDFLIPRRQVIDVLTGEKGTLTLEYFEDKSNPNDVRHKVTMNIGPIEFKFDGMSVANFPQTPTPSAAMLTLDGALVKKAIERTAISISSEKSRYTLNATLLKSVGGSVIMVATDGHRLSHVTVGEGTIKDSLILPAATKWLLNNCKGQVSIGFDEDLHTIRTESGTILSRKVTGQFPNYDAVMPRDNKVAVTFSSPKELAGLLKRVSKCADERSGAIKLAVTFGSVEISASSTERGSAKASLAVMTDGLSPKGEIVMGFNSAYIEDFLKVIDEDVFTFRIKDAQSSGLIEVDNFNYIIMPMRI